MNDFILSLKKIKCSDVINITLFDLANGKVKILSNDTEMETMKIQWLEEPSMCYECQKCPKVNEIWNVDYKDIADFNIFIGERECTMSTKEINKICDEIDSFINERNEVISAQDGSTAINLPALFSDKFFGDRLVSHEELMKMVRYGFVPRESIIKRSKDEHIVLETEDQPLIEGYLPPELIQHSGMKILFYRPSLKNGLKRVWKIYSKTKIRCMDYSYSTENSIREIWIDDNDCDEDSFKIVITTNTYEDCSLELNYQLINGFLSNIEIDRIEEIELLREGYTVS